MEVHVHPFDIFGGVDHKSRGLSLDRHYGSVSDMDVIIRDVSSVVSMSSIVAS